LTATKKYSQVGSRHRVRIRDIFSDKANFELSYKVALKLTPSSGSIAVAVSVIFDKQYQIE
jgi:hypothetical protein